MTHRIRLRPVIENLIIAQRALTRAVEEKDSPARQTALAERDRCSDAIENAFRAIELAHTFAVQEQERLKNREINLSSILIRLNAKHPDVVGAGIEAELLRLEVDPRMGEAFLSTLGEAIEDGLAVRRGPNDVRITFAGVQQLVAAKRLRFDLDGLRAELFRVERTLRAHMENAQPAPSRHINEPRKAAVGE